ncbi:MAG: HU family DNA-binding protein [Selenomonadaceae bacterium]|nr:HU family DNA-binding protein [Selenomonadaceae bacterium]
MTKKDIINVISKTTGNSQKVTAEVVDSLLANIKTELGKGGSVEFMGFGTFGVVDRAERTGNNPRTGEKLIIPAHKAVNFKSSKILSEIVNANKKIPTEAGNE